MSKPLAIDEHRLERVMRKVDAHEETCRLGVYRCQTCKVLYREVADVVNIACDNVKAPPHDR